MFADRACYGRVVTGDPVRTARQVYLVIVRLCPVRALLALYWPTVGRMEGGISLLLFHRDWEGCWGRVSVGGRGFVVASLFLF